MATKSAALADAYEPDSHGFVRGIGLLQATAINMTQMVGIGPFITIPVMVAAFGGPQALMGWVVGAILAMADGLVWAELGAAMPGAGGTYLYLREAFQYRTGRLMPFMFVWTAVFFIPLIMATGVAGFVLYLGNLWPALASASTVTVLGVPTRPLPDAVGVVVTAAVVFLLYRRIESVAKVATVLWAVMLVSVLAVILAAYTHWDPSLAFKFPPDAFTPNGKFFVGLGIGLVIGIYDYLGYNTVSYIGDEVRRPGRVLPFAIILSIVAIMLMYLVMNVGVLGVLPTDKITSSPFLAADVVAKNWGGTASHVVTVLILITAFASVYCGLLGGSRVPYNAARDGVFLGQFGTLHPTLRFPRFALLVMGGITAIGSFFDIGTLIACLTSTIVLVQALGQVAAVIVLRRRQPDLPRPYKMWLYPVPAVVAAVLWICAYVVFAVPDQRLAANNPAHPSWLPVAVSLGIVAAGAIAFLVWARVERTWPFGPNEIREEYVQAAGAESVHGPA